MADEKKTTETRPKTATKSKQADLPKGSAARKAAVLRGELKE